MASQDDWARPLAKELVDVFRVDGLTYVRVEQGSYDPATGDVTETETTYAKAGAVLSTNETEGGGVAGEQEIQVWIDMQGIDDIWPTTRDRLEYQDKKWKVVAIDPKYSGDKLYACKLTGRYA